ncbi:MULTISPECIES: helix-turn-helix transcriptional regulator [Ferrimonas]|uniref:helix-turn-helix transcriptional regulator n=1 Tax=Ferrimonas TaxID=44011 RepID=UPI000416E009|nr:MULTISPECIES: helix-turn-helix transcriptional regulator [Ferrimonas]USD39080.1 helix-turn-helix transcriptional regulator [Ferrimonas sp. SCSIO 43195]
MALQQCGLVSSSILEDFVNRLEPCGFNRFYYAIVTDDEYSIRDTLGCCSNLNASRMVNLRRMRFAVASDASILEYRDEYLHRYAQSDETFARLGPALRKRHNPFIWPGNVLPSRRLKSFQRFQQRFGVDARATYYHPLPERPGWLGVCHLFSPLSVDEVNDKVNQDFSEFKNLLSHYCETFTALSFGSINPLANFGVLSSTCIQILSLVADGYSSEEIGEQLYMSERGVNYHLDRARQILMARNRTNLISKAFRQGVI